MENGAGKMKITKRQLKRIIRESINEAEFYDETPEGQLIGTEAEDARFNQQLAAEKAMKQAGLSKSEMSQVSGWLKSGDIDAEFYGSSAYEKLYGYFFDEHEMPMGIAKAEDGEPDIWILDYLNGDVGDLSWSMAAK